MLMILPAFDHVADSAAVDYIADNTLLIMLMILPASDHVADSAAVDYIADNTSVDYVDDIASF